MTVAKALGNGVPIGTCVAEHTRLSIIADQRPLDDASRMGASTRSRLRQRLADLGQVRQIRGKELLVGIDIDRPCASLVERQLKRAILIDVTSGTVLRPLPPLIMDPDAAMQAAGGVVKLLQEFVAGTTAGTLN